MSAPPDIPAVQNRRAQPRLWQYGRAQLAQPDHHRGDLFGFIGSNGAGKTTTLRILAPSSRPSSGRAEVLGYDVVRDADRVRHLIGYMPDFFGVYKDMEVTEYLDFFGAC